MDIWIEVNTVNFYCLAFTFIMKFITFVISGISVLCWVPLSGCFLDYELISIETSFTNGNYMSSELSMEFIRRGCYGGSGYMYFNKEILDDDLVAEVTIGYNFRHYRTFAATPFHAGPTDFLSLMNRYYRKYAMRALANCSNAPQSDTDWENLEDFGQNITFNKCPLYLEHFIEMRSGYYCITFHAAKNMDGDTPIDLAIKFIVHLDNSLDNF